jgi:hypothetical protein
MQGSDKSKPVYTDGKADAAFNAVLIHYPFIFELCE